MILYQRHSVLSKQPSTKWIPVLLRSPTVLEAVEVTVQSPQGERFRNVGFMRDSSTWQLLIDGHHYQDCKVIAWATRMPIYEGE